MGFREIRFKLAANSVCSFLKLVDSWSGSLRDGMAVAIY